MKSRRQKWKTGRSPAKRKNQETGAIAIPKTEIKRMRAEIGIANDRPCLLLHGDRQ
ncbi:MAG: hypothetical protein WBA57_06125 [Elainellaceae cyanobacterium]